jgi:hypothetical protein
LQNKILTQNFSKKIKFLRLKDRLSEKNMKKIGFASLKSLKKKGVGSGILKSEVRIRGSGSAPKMTRIHNTASKFERWMFCGVGFSWVGLGKPSRRLKKKCIAIFI